MKNSEKPATYEQLSAGGVAYRESEAGTEVAIILTEPERRWQLPKGMVDPGETPEQAARREIREEAGIETELIEPLDVTEYWFTAEHGGVRRRIHKHVRWYLMKYISGDVADHDDEVAEARWVSIDEALDLLVFKNEREVVQKAADKIRN